MAKAPLKPVAGTTPEEFPQVPPKDLYSTSDIRFVMLEIGKLTTKVDRLIEDVSGQSEKLDKVCHQVTFVKGALYVIGALMGIVIIAAGWYFSGKLSITLNPGG